MLSVQDAKNKYRFHVLILSCFSLLGLYVSCDYPAMLEDQIKTDMNLNSFEYNLLFSVQTFPSIITPFFAA